MDVFCLVAIGLVALAIVLGLVWPIHDNPDDYEDL
jgi:hypothetical protein